MKSGTDCNVIGFIHTNSWCGIIKVRRFREAKIRKILLFFIKFSADFLRRNGGVFVI